MVWMRNEYKLKHQDDCTNWNKIKRIYIRSYGDRGQFFKPLGMICETCLAISLEDWYYDMRRKKEKLTYGEFMKKRNQGMSISVIYQEKNS